MYHYVGEGDVRGEGDGVGGNIGRQDQLQLALHISSPTTRVHHIGIAGARGARTGCWSGGRGWGWARGRSWGSF